MKTFAIILAAAAAGCAGLGGTGAEGTYEESAPASAGAVFCARDELRTLGYTVRQWQAGDNISGEKSFDSGSSRSTGYLTVTVVAPEGSEARTLRVVGERYAAAEGSPGGAVPRPQPRPEPYDTAWRSRGRRPGETRRRIDPGPVAVDARRVVGRCGVHAETRTADASR